MRSIAFVAGSMGIFTLLAGASPAEETDSANAGDGSKAAVRGAGGNRDSRYEDRSGETLETVTGEVTLLRRAGGAEGNPSGAPVITVRTEKGEIIFHVGPPFFRKEHDFPIAVGDTLTASGWRDDSFGYDSLLVKTVKNGDKTLEVRDASGERLWKRPDPADDGSPFESITGTVVAFGMKAHQPGGAVEDQGENGVVLLRTDEGELYAHVGPASFRQEKGLNLAVGDTVTVRAWRIDARMANRPFVIVRGIAEDNVDVEVRTERRRPLWK